MEPSRLQLPESKGEYEMIRTITANVEVRRTIDYLAVIEWYGNQYGEPTEENILKALNDGNVVFDDVIYAANHSIEEYLSVSNIEEKKD